MRLSVLPRLIAKKTMIPRIRTIALAGALAGTPYVATQTDVGRDTVSSITGTLSDSTLTPVRYSETDNALHDVENLREVDGSRFRYDKEVAARLGGLPAGRSDQPTLVGQPIHDIREILRFDISPQWVINRFSRVSTVLADLHLEALRVPIVTGTGASDIAGTLTYYFDHKHQLQRVTIHGFTGNPTTLVNSMTQHYGLAKEPTLEAGVLTRRWNGQPVHFLRLSHAPVVYSDAVHQKYTVFLELNQPDLAYGISPEAQQIVGNDRGSGRW